MTEHERIWLQPWCSTCSMSEDRNWCQDDVWGGCEGDGCPQRSVEYVRADLVATPAEVAALREEAKRMRELAATNSATANTALVQVGELETQVAALRAERDRALVDWHNLRAEVERLKAALTKIRDAGLGPDRGSAQWTADLCRNLARAALEPKP